MSSMSFPPREILPDVRRGDGDAHRRARSQTAARVSAMRLHLLSSPKLVAGCIVIADGRILLLKRGIEPSLGKWTYPGGFVDLGETPEKPRCARRSRKSESALARAAVGHVHRPCQREGADHRLSGDTRKDKPTVSQEAIEIRYFRLKISCGTPWLSEHARRADRLGSIGQIQLKFLKSSNHAALANIFISNTARLVLKHSCHGPR